MLTALSESITAPVSHQTNNTLQNRRVLYLARQFNNCLDIQVLHILRIGGDKGLARRHFITHQHLENLVGFSGVFHIDLQ